MLALLVLFASTALASNVFVLDTDKRYCADDLFGIERCDWRAEHSGSSCTIYAKNGRRRKTESTKGPEDSTLLFAIYFNSHVSIHRNTWLWTSCSDALLIDRAFLYDENNDRSWGYDNGDAWCLSTDGNDYKGWTGADVQGCYRTLRFDKNGLVYFYHNQNWTPRGRRSLAGVPTLEDVQECEADDSRDQSACNALVDQILTYDINHPELAELLPEFKDEGLDLVALQQEQMPAEPMTFDDYLVYAFAALGVAAFVGGAYKTFQKWSSSSEHVPISYQSATNELEI